MTVSSGQTRSGDERSLGIPDHGSAAQGWPGPPSLPTAGRHPTAPRNATCATRPRCGACGTPHARAAHTRGARSPVEISNEKRAPPLPSSRFESLRMWADRLLRRLSSLHPALGRVAQRLPRGGLRDTICGIPGRKTQHWRAATGRSKTASREVIR